MLNMSKIKYTTETNGYVNNFILIGDLANSKSANIDDFDIENFDCYKEVDGELVWDEDKYRAKVNPTALPSQPSDLERIVQLEQENKLLKAQNNALTERTDFHEEVLAEIILTITL